MTDHPHFFLILSHGSTSAIHFFSLRLSSSLPATTSQLCSSEICGWVAREQQRDGRVPGARTTRWCRCAWLCRRLQPPSLLEMTTTRHHRVATASREVGTAEAGSWKPSDDPHTFVGEELQPPIEGVATVVWRSWSQRPLPTMELQPYAYGAPIVVWRSWSQRHRR